MATVTTLAADTQEQELRVLEAETLSPEDPLYEVINGRRVELPPMGAGPTQIASTLTEFLGTFSRTNRLGRVNSEMLYWIDESAGLKRRPDVAFVSYSRWPRNKPVPDEEAWDIVPELTVEVVSPTDKAEDLLEKIAQYFDAGVIQVWVVYPRRRVVHVYETFTRIAVVVEGQDLEGGTILPGFKLRLGNLFEDLQAADVDEG